MDEDTQALLIAVKNVLPPLDGSFLPHGTIKAISVNDEMADSIIRLANLVPSPKERHKVRLIIDGEVAVARIYS